MIDVMCVKSMRDMCLTLKFNEIDSNYTDKNKKNKSSPFVPRNPLSRADFLKDFNAKRRTRCQNSFGEGEETEIREEQQI